MPNYQELRALAERHQADRFAFEQKATTKAVELHNALTEALGAPPEAVDAMKLQAADGEVSLNDEYILTPTGLRFGVVVRIGQAQLRTSLHLAPLGNLFILSVPGRKDIDVTEKVGVTEWTDWMAHVLEEKLRQNISGRLSALMAQRAIPE